MKLQEIFNETFNLMAFDTYYSFLRLLVKVLQPKQIVEFGAYKGLSAAMMMDFLPEDGHIYSVDKGKTSWELLADHPQLTKVIGDDNDLNTWKGIDIDLGKTDLWFIDAWHDEHHVLETLKIYGEYFKQGTILVFDDTSTIHKAWTDLPYEKMNLPVHYPGFGIAIV